MALLSPGKISLILFTKIKITLRSKLPTLNEGVPATAGGVVSVADSRRCHFERIQVGTVEYQMPTSKKYFSILCNYLLHKTIVKLLFI